jgi:hypothetical protein
VFGVRTLIGIITGTRRDKYEDQIAWIRPIVAANNGSWDAIVSPESDFPTRGFIFWPRAMGAKERALIRFHAKENPVKSDGPDEFVVADSQPIFEVIDLRAVGDCEQVRLALTNGIDLPYLSSPKYLIRCVGDLLVGPITLVCDSAGKATLEKNNRARIHCYQLPDDAFVGITFEEEARTILAGALPPSPYSYVDWDDDRMVMRRAIEAAAKLKGNGASLSRHLIEDATAQLTQFGADATARLEIYRLKRARQLASDTQQVVSLAKEIFTGLWDHPSVVQEVQKFVQAQRDEIRSRIELEHVAEQETLTKLRQQRKETEEALRTAIRQLEETEVRLNDQASGVETALNERIDQVLGNVPALLADVALLKPFLESRSLQNRGTSSIEMGMPAVADAAALTLNWPSAQVKIAEIKELRPRIIHALRSFGVQTTAYQPIHAAFATGLMPIVSGARALEALEAYAHVMCAGRILVVEVTSAIADVQDLFGKLEGRSFIPHPAGLIDVVRAARENEGPFLVVLDGANRGPTESYLLPLLRLIRSRTASVPLFHPHAVSSSDPYWPEARLQWPANLLLAATVTEGPTTLPVAPGVWNQSILAAAEADGESTGADELGEPSEVNGSSVLLDAAPLRDPLDWISEELPRLHGLAKQMAGGLAALTTDQTMLQTAIVKSIVVPYVAAISDEDERAAEVARLEKTFGKDLGDSVSLARRSIA